MSVLTDFKLKPQFKAIGAVSYVSEVKEIETQNGKFYIQNFAIETVYGKPEKPFVETIVFQCTSRATSKWDKESSSFIQAPSFIEQFKEKPLEKGAVVEVTLSVSGYVSSTAEKPVLIPKVTLERLWRFNDEKAAEVNALLFTAKSNREAQGI